MTVLLDTQTFLWWIDDSPRLSRQARAVIGSKENDVLWSAASSWEVAIKWALGKLRLPATPAVYLSKQLALQRVRTLPVQHEHACRVAELPQHHRDPFDRMLVAQAQIEAIKLVTVDPRIRAYDVEVVW